MQHAHRPHHLRRAARRIGLVVAALTVLAGCQADATVQVDVNSRGGGVVAVAVTLDPEAQAAVDDPVTQIKVDDLAADGWKIADPVKRSNGDITVQATRRFSDLAEGNRVLETLGGPNGILRGAKLTSSSPVGRHVTEFEGTLDFSKGSETFGDADLRRLLGGSSTGGQVEAMLDGDDSGLASVRFEVGLPGSIRSASTGRRREGRIVWQASYGAQPVALAATSQRVEIVPVAGFAIGLLLLIGAGMAYAARSRPGGGGRDGGFGRPGPRLGPRPDGGDATAGRGRGGVREPEGAFRRVTARHDFDPLAALADESAEYYAVSRSGPAEPALAPSAVVEPDVEPPLIAVVSGLFERPPRPTSGGRWGFDPIGHGPGSMGWSPALGAAVGSTARSAFAAVPRPTSRAVGRPAAQPSVVRVPDAPSQTAACPPAVSSTVAEVPEPVAEAVPSWMELIRRARLEQAQQAPDRPASV